MQSHSVDKEKKENKISTLHVCTPKQQQPHTTHRLISKSRPANSASSPHTPSHRPGPADLTPSPHHATSSAAHSSTMMVAAGVRRRGSVVHCHPVASACGSSAEHRHVGWVPGAATQARLAVGSPCHFRGPGRAAAAVSSDARCT